MNILCRQLNGIIKECFKPSPSPTSIHVCVPDDILIEILLRVATDDVINCKSVCRRWRDLISSALFVNLHIKNLSRGEDESLLVRSYYGYSSGMQNFYYNVSPNNKRERSSSRKSTSKVDFLVNCSLTNFYKCTITNSCDGLLVLDDGYWLRIFNPATRVLRKIDKSPTKVYYHSCTHLYGIYFDRFRDEYKLFSVAYGPKGYMDQYFFFSLSRNVWESFYRTRSSDFRVDQYSQAAIVGDVMYWIGTLHERHCSKVVVAFDIQREHFYCLPHPPVNEACAITQIRLIVIHQNMMRLIVKDGQLCFCHTLAEKRIINLWILEDNANWESWVLQYKMDLLCIDSSFRLRGVPSQVVYNLLGKINIVCFRENSNEIVFTLEHRLMNMHAGVWLYNVETHQTKSLGASSIRRGRGGYNTEFIVIPYNKTLVSPFM